MVNKKIILSVLIIGCIATVASAGTWAYFDDTKESNGNTITAGTLVLSPGENALSSFKIGPLAPGDSGTAKSLTLTNAGNLKGYLYAEISQSSEISDLTTTINGNTMSNGAKIYLGEMAPTDKMNININYDFKDTKKTQNEQQGKSATYTIKYHLQQLKDSNNNNNNGNNNNNNGNNNNNNGNNNNNNGNNNNDNDGDNED